MRHRIYDRILYTKYIQLNHGLQIIKDAWGYGCPIGMPHITSKEMEYDRNKRNESKKFWRLEFSIDEYLYNS